MGKWKIERWTDGVKKLPASHFDELRTRELVIVGVATLDAGLVELLDRRLCGTETERIEFLGANEDGRATCGSFGSRIQLGVVVGAITPAMAMALRALKNLRNYLAHRVDADATRGRGLELSTTAVDAFATLMENEGEMRAGFLEPRSKLGDPVVSRDVVSHMVLLVTLAIDHQLDGIQRIEIGADVIGPVW